MEGIAVLRACPLVTQSGQAEMDALVGNLDQGARRGYRQRLNRGRYEERLDDDLPQLKASP